MANSFQQLTIEYSQSAASFRSVCDLAPLGLPAIENFANFVNGVAGSMYPSKFTFYTGAVKATGTIVSSAGGAANGETCTILGVTFTAVTSGATGAQFNISATAATQAANIASAINAYSAFSGIITAAVTSGGTVTVTAVVPGVIGNGLFMADVNLANTAITTFANGSNGTAYTIDRL